HIDQLNLLRDCGERKQHRQTQAGNQPKLVNRTRVSHIHLQQLHSRESAECFKNKALPRALEQTLHALNLDLLLKIQGPECGVLILHTGESNLIAMKQPNTSLSFLELWRVVPHHIVTVRKKDYNRVTRDLSLQCRGHGNFSLVPVGIMLRPDMRNLGGTHRAYRTAHDSVCRGHFAL